MTPRAKPRNGRTHEPSLRELTAELDGIRELMLEKIEGVKNIMMERHDLYKERDNSRSDAVDAALASAKEAVEKTEITLNEYKKAANEWRDTVKDLVGLMPTKETVDKDIKIISEKIVDLQDWKIRIIAFCSGISFTVGLIVYFLGRLGR